MQEYTIENQENATIEEMKAAMETAIAGIMVLNIPEDSDHKIVYLGDEGYKDAEEATIPCDRCESGEMTYHVQRKKEETTFIHGSMVTADAIDTVEEELVYVEAFRSGHLIPQYKRVDTDGDSENDDIFKFNLESQAYEQYSDEGIIND